ncbi:hypothetical protein SKAU_G00368340 [Synaphobranchus kaupii]|uniref:Uncharacterized protein n=1 Tax=Synaphobranchus kaupii TaxID=118154 RepID=A0A9Q1EFJ5_SYNKA|nr:hypothetical protein SKAU_G00368340 [Synaphobranchus kaupii]
MKNPPERSVSPGSECSAIGAVIRDWSASAPPSASLPNELRARQSPEPVISESRSAQEANGLAEKLIQRLSRCHGGPGRTKRKCDACPSVFNSLQLR